MFSISKVFDQSWNVVKGNLPLIAGLTLVQLVVTGLGHYIPVVGWLLFGPLSAGYVNCLMRIRVGKPVDYADLFWAFQNLNRLGHFVLLAVLNAIGTTVGFFLLVIPGIWFLVANYFSGALIVLDEEPDAIGAIKKSIAITKGQWWNVFLFVLSCGLLMLAGAMCFIVGLLVSTPVVALMLLHATEESLAQFQKNTPATAIASQASSPVDSVPQA